MQPTAFVKCNTADAHAHALWLVCEPSSLMSSAVFFFK
jgi:hypothetical protein